MEQTTQILLEQGLTGAIVVLLIGVVAYLARKLDQKDTIISELNKQLVLVSDKWRESETERSNRLMEIASTGNAVQSALVDKIRLGREQK